MEDFVAPKADIEEEQGFVAPAQDIVDNGEKKKEFSSPAPVSVGSTSSASTLSMDVLKPQNNPKTPDLTGVGAFAPPTNLQDFNKPQETERVEKVIQKRIDNPTLLPAEQAAQQNPSRDTHFLLGNEYLKSGDYEQAIMSFDEAANFPQKETSTLSQDKAFGQQIASNDDALAYGIGKAYQKLGKNEDAKRMWEVALEKNPNNVEALKGLAWDAYNNDDATKATYLSAAAQAAQEKLIPLQSEKVGESEYELDKEKRANLIVQAAEGIILGNDAALSLISPVAFGRSFVEGGVDLVKGMGESLKEAIDLANEYNRKAMAGEEITAEDVLLPQSKIIEGAIKGGFAYMQATQPEVFAAWHLGNATAEAVLPEDIIKTIMTPASQIIDNAGNDKLKQSVTNILDTFGNLVIFHKLSGLVKPKELARKVKNNEPLNGEETKAFVEALEKTGEEEAKKAVEKTEENNVLQAKKEELNNQLLEAEETIKNIPVGETPAEKIEAKLLKQKVVEATKPIEEELTKIIEKEYEEVAAELGVVEPVESEPKKVEPVKVGEGAGKEEPKEVGSGVGGDVVTFKGKRGQADSISFDGKEIKQGEEIELTDVNISQDDSMPDLRSGKYKVRMLSVDANGKTATLTLTDGNEVITTTVKDLRKSEQSLPTQEAKGKSEGGGVGGDENAWGSDKGLTENFYTTDVDGYAIKKTITNPSSVTIDGVDFHIAKVDGDWKVIEKKSGLEISTGKISNTKNAAIEDATIRLAQNGGAKNLPTLIDRAIQGFKDRNTKAVEQSLPTQEAKVKEEPKEVGSGVGGDVKALSNTDRKILESNNFKDVDGMMMNMEGTRAWSKLSDSTKKLLKKYGIHYIEGYVNFDHLKGGETSHGNFVKLKNGEANGIQVNVSSVGDKFNIEKTLSYQVFGWYQCFRLLF